jgi:hypothetical protein
MPTHYIATNCGLVAPEDSASKFTDDIGKAGKFNTYWEAYKVALMISCHVKYYVILSATDHSSK